jgi:hypothetical protein
MAMPEKEATARIKINKLLEAAGWRFFQEGHAPANIRLEPGVTIKSADLDALGDNFEATSRGFVDFLLLDARGFPLIVLEAKAEDKNPLVGKEQARKYARSQNCRLVIVSNGNLHYFWDLERGNPYVITTFPTPESAIGYRRRNPSRTIAGRRQPRTDRPLREEDPGHSRLRLGGGERGSVKDPELTGIWNAVLATPQATGRSPFPPIQTRHGIEMLVAAQNGQSMLQRKRCDPRVIGRDGRALLFEHRPQRRVGSGGLVRDGYQVEVPQLRLQPILIRGTMPRLRNSVTKFPEHNYRDARPRLMAQHFANRRIAIDKCGQRVGIQDHSRSSASTTSNAPSITP